jgi:hypothetical protein
MIAYRMVSQETAFEIAGLCREDFIMALQQFDVSPPVFPVSIGFTTIGFTKCSVTNNILINNNMVTKSNIFFISLLF